MSAAFSVEIPRADARTAPPYTDGCPKCVSESVVLAPIGVIESGRGVKAVYRHKACGHAWTCNWAYWSGAGQEISAARDSRALAN